VRISFQATPWDIFVSLGYTVLVTGLLLALNAGNILAVLLVAFVPGYVLVAALFPGNQRISWLERTVMSFGLSIAVVPLLGIALNNTPFGIRLGPIASATALFSLVFGFFALYRRMRLPESGRLRATLDLAWPWGRGYTSREKVLTVVLAASLVVAAASLTYAILLPPPVERFTEFYVLGLGGKASDYPAHLNVSVATTVNMGLVNHEGATTNYTIQVDLVGTRLVYNATSGTNESVELNRTTWSKYDLSIQDGQNWSRPFTFSIAFAGSWKVQFLLFKQDDFVSVYRELHIFVLVS